jgi:preprotein translocase subunit YajC
MLQRCMVPRPARAELSCHGLLYTARLCTAASAAKNGCNTMDFFINSAHAQAAAASGGGQSILSALMLPVLLLVVFYFLLIRPQNKRAKEQKEMLSKVAAGDEVATTGGILGKVIEVGEQFLTLEIASGVSIKLQKFQVAQVLPKGTVKSA